MQYIQLQGQVAANLDLPLEGGFNLFIDTADGTIKAKDSEGNLTGGGISLTELTKAQLDDAIDGGDLTPGAFYKITGVSSGSNERYIQEGGTTVILQAATTSSLNPKGVGLFWNPDYSEYDVWTNTFEFAMDRYVTGEFFDMEETILLDAPCNVVLRPNIFENRMIATLTNSEDASYFTGSANYPIPFEGDNTGISGSLTSVQSFPSFNVGNKVIWGGRVWVNLNGELGSDDGQWTIEGPEWALVPYSSADYNLVADIIEYDYVNDMICYRKDVVHNVEVISNYAHVNDDGDRNGIRQFPWGHPQVYGVTLENTDTQNLVNFPNTNTINELHMKHGSRFEANYWGKNNGFYNIFGDCDSDIDDLSLGKYVDFNEIRLGINSTIGGEGSLYIVGNDGTTISDITMGTNCEIWGMNMYQYARLDNITMEMDADIYNINMYDDSSIVGLDMSMNSRLYDISMGDSSQIYDITFEADSYLADINMNNDSEIYTSHLGRSSNIDYILLENNCYLREIELGINSYINCINLYNSNNIGNSYMAGIKLGNDSSIANVDLYPDTYISNINGSVDFEIGSLTITGSGAYIQNFEIEQNAGFGSMTIDASNTGSYLYNFKIGQNEGFGQMNIQSQNSNVTIEKGFNNFKANEFTLGVTASFDNPLYSQDIGDMTELDASKTFHILDTTGWNGSNTNLYYYLPDGYYNGQTVKFFTTDDGTNMGDMGGIRIWCTLATSTNVYTRGLEPWYPFQKYDAVAQQYIIRNDVPTAIWLNGSWIIDNNNWD